MKNTELRKAREKAGLTQAQIAEKSGITTRAYQYYEAGEREPTVRIAKLIAKLLNSTVEELF